MKIITLYIFTIQGIFVWDFYPTLEACMETKQKRDVKLVNTHADAECIRLGRTVEDFMKEEGIL